LNKIGETGLPVGKVKAKPVEYYSRRLMTKRDLEEYLQVSDRTVDDIVSQRRIEYIKFGREVRFDFETVRKALAECTVRRGKKK